MVGLQVKVGLSVDHELFDGSLLKKATEMILKTRDGKQWFAVPKPLGTCAFISSSSLSLALLSPSPWWMMLTLPFSLLPSLPPSLSSPFISFSLSLPRSTPTDDASDEELESVLAQHKEYIKEKFPQLKNGQGIDSTLDAFVDTSSLSVPLLSDDRVLTRLDSLLLSPLLPLPFCLSPLPSPSSAPTWAVLQNHSPLSSRHSLEVPTSRASRPPRSRASPSTARPPTPPSPPRRRPTSRPTKPKETSDPSPSPSIAG
jgi:hypothetical protein